MKTAPWITASVLSLVVASPVLSQGSTGGQGIEFTLRGGISAKPEYFGSENLAYGPDFSLSDLHVRFAGRDFGGGERQGFGLRGSFRYIGERDPEDYGELFGLDPVDASVELGLGVSYVSRGFEAFGDLRYGVVGHEALVAELGADAVFRPSSDFTVRFGPRVLMGDDTYADTYFGVTPAESAASGGTFASYDAEAGAVSAGLELGMTYDINDDWGIDSAVTYEQFVGSAADSPIIAQGTNEQLSIRLGVTRNISLGF